MRKLLILLFFIPAILVGQNLTEALTRFIPGQFHTAEQPDGSYKVVYKRGALIVELSLPGKPLSNQDRITYISTSPIVQLSFITLSKGDSTPAEQAKVILDSIADEYTKIGLNVGNITRESPDSRNFKYTLELSNGIKEYLHVKVNTREGVDLIAFTRVILSPNESVEAREKGNAIASKFFNSIRIK